MADSAEPIFAAPSTVVLSDTWAITPRQRWFEVGLVLLVAFAGPILNAVYILANGSSAAPRLSNARWIYGIVQELTGLLLVGYILSRRKLRFRDIGLRWSLKDLGRGVLIAIASTAAYTLGYWLIQALSYLLQGSFVRPPTGGDFFSHPPVAFVAYSLVNPFFEELIVRAYLMTEVYELTRSSVFAVVFSVAIQSSYHLYYGWTGALSLSFVFLIFALYYVRARRALPVIVAHGIWDIYALIRVL